MPRDTLICDLASFADEVRRLAAVIDTPADLLPTFGRTDDGARPHIEFDGVRFHFVVVERGGELERRSSSDPQEILYCVFDATTFSMACTGSAGHRRAGEDSRRQLFDRQLALLGALSPAWRERRREQLDATLREHPFMDDREPADRIPSPPTPAESVDETSLRLAMTEAVRLAAYDPVWPALFAEERARLLAIAPELIAVEHIGSTAVAGMAAKPTIDLIATVPSMSVADVIVERLCRANGGYTASAEFNRTLGDRRWLMRHAGGHRTHHLHLVLPGSTYWLECIRFRDALRADVRTRADYTALKSQMVVACRDDREAYTAGKSAFIADVLKGFL